MADTGEMRETGAAQLTRREVIAGGVILLGAVVLPTPLGCARAQDARSGLEFATAGQAAEAIRRRTVSSSELTQLTLERIDKYNPSLNAIVNVLKDEALTAAKAADEALARGEDLGALHGVPITVKESFKIKGVPATAGVKAWSNKVASEDSTVVARLRAAGAILIGNTNVPEYLGDWQSYNEIYGVTNNPWDLTRTPGGSSGGSAAALAAGLGYLSMGSDIGGSIRVPAHFCGVYGHKPTLNLVPLRGHIAVDPDPAPRPPVDLPVAGPMARSAADLKMALEIVGGPDREDAVAYRWSLPPARLSRLSDFRVGYVLDDLAYPLSSNVKRILSGLVESLRGLGVQMEEGWPPGVDALQQYRTYRYLLSAFGASQMKDEGVNEVREQAARNDGSIETLEARAWVDPHKSFQAASVERIAARLRWQEYFRTHDVFLMPTDFVPAFQHDHSTPLGKRQLETPEGSRAYVDQLFWISFATLTGLPATTAPAGQTRDGLPVGVQILGPYLEDATPIQFAHQVAEELGGFEQPPGY